MDFTTIIICGIFGIVVHWVIDKKLYEIFQNNTAIVPFKYINFDSEFYSKYKIQIQNLYDFHDTFPKLIDFGNEKKIKELIKNINVKNPIQSISVYCLIEFNETMYRKSKFLILSDNYFLESPKCLDFCYQFYIRNIYTHAEYFNEQINNKNKLIVSEVACIILILSSKKSDKKALKKNFLNIKHEKLKVLVEKFNNEASFRNTLIIFLRNNIDIYGFWLHTYFYHFPHYSYFSLKDEIQLELDKLNVSLLYKENYKNLMEIITEKVKSALLPPENLSQAYCFCCNRRPKLAQVGEYSFLICPICEETNAIETGFEKIRLTLKPTNEKGSFQLLQHSQMKIMEADELIISKIENIDINRLLVSFHNECLNLKINGNIRYVLEDGVEIEENTKRMLGVCT